jgi:hypothetical protein
MFGAENPDFRRLDLSLRYAIPNSRRGVGVTLIGEVFSLTNRTNSSTPAVWSPVPPDFSSRLLRSGRASFRSVRDSDSDSHHL